jgi:c-di-GMP-binding flagellar brake protein YcgR
MPVLQELRNEQINEALAGAVERHVPLTLTVRSGGRWVNIRSRAILVRGQHFIIELPTMEDHQTPYELAPAEKCGVSFKLKHHKHIFSATVVGLERVRLKDQTEVVVACLCSPTQMQRLQRRAYERVDVPANRIVRASVWLGGMEAEPAGTSPERPVWSGRVLNISAGGFQMRTTKEAPLAVDVNDIVGVRLVFGTGQETVYADAQFRHAQPDGSMSLLGFQFVGLAESIEGQATLQFITTKVSEFLRAERYADARRR